MADPIAIGPFAPFELVNVSGGPFPLLNRDRTCVMVALSVLCREAPYLRECLVEVTIATGRPARFIIPSTLHPRHAELTPSFDLDNWVELLDLSAYEAVCSARSGGGKTLEETRAPWRGL